MRKHEITEYLAAQFRPGLDHIRLWIDGAEARTWSDRAPDIELAILGACMGATRSAELRIQTIGENARKARRVRMPIGADVDTSDRTTPAGSTLQAAQAYELLNAHVKVLHGFISDTLRDTRDSQREAREALAKANEAYAQAFAGYLESQIRTAAVVESYLSAHHERDLAAKAASADLDERREFLQTVKPLVGAVATRIGLAPGETMPAGPILAWWQSIAKDTRSAMLGALEPASRETLLRAMADHDAEGIQAWFAELRPQTGEKLLEMLTVEQRSALAVLFGQT